MITEMHCHTAEHSNCSHVPAEDLVKGAMQKGIQAMVITDHHYHWDKESLHALKKKAGAPHYFKLFSGQEINTRDYGHVLMYGPQETVTETRLTLEELHARFPEAVLVWAHPFRHGYRPPPERMQNSHLHGIEVLNSNYGVQDIFSAMSAWHKLRFTAIAGTDTHALSYVGSYPTIFDHPIRHDEELAREIRAGRCRPFLKEIPRGGTSSTRVREISIGPKNTKLREKVIAKVFTNTASWKSAERAYHVARRLSHHGFSNGQFRIPAPLAKDPSELTVIEESVSGETLFDVMKNSDEKRARAALHWTALCLVKLHETRLRLTPREEFLNEEPPRMQIYINKILARKHPQAFRVAALRDRVLELEKILFEKQSKLWIQGHGDFHPKNIILGSEGLEHCFPISMIDFTGSYVLPAAFDVGTFAAQYLNMTFHFPEIRVKAPVSEFLETYRQHRPFLEPDFHGQVELFKARTIVSILYYLVKLGLGDGENFWTMLVEAEKSLASLYGSSFLSTGLGHTPNPHR